MRSSRETNYARYLNTLKRLGVVISRDYEPKTFWFEKIKRGVRSYKPDFYVCFADGRCEYHEVKGWMDAKSKTKIKRFAKYYPNEKLVVIDKEVYKSIMKNNI